jgi:hypothetical protein
MKQLRVLAAALAFLTASSLQTGTAAAGVQWCEEDPEFLVNGALVDASMLFPGSYASKVSEVHFDLQIPSNATAVVVSLPGTVPVTASISRTLSPYYGLLSIPVVLTVTAKTTSTFTTYTYVTGLGGTLVNTISGDSTKPTKVKFWMYGL